MNMDLKKRIIKCMVWSVALYGAETWAITQADRKRLAAFEISEWRRIEKISWINKISIEEVLQGVQESRRIIDSVQQCKHRWNGHILGTEICYGTY